MTALGIGRKAPCIPKILLLNYLTTLFLFEVLSSVKFYGNMSK